MFTCSKYNINVEEFFKSLCPPFWLVDYDTGTDKEVWLSYLELIGTGLSNVQQGVYNNALDLREFLLVTGQHMSLEEHLNDVFDPILRRIYIQENNLPAAGEVWYTYGETDPVNKVWYTYGELDPVPKAWYTQSESINIYHFEVMVPATLVFVQEVMQGEIDPYVVNGYNYKITKY